MNKKLSKFIAATQEEFLFLLKKGFVIPNDGVVQNQLYGGINYYGVNVCIAFGYDLREKYVECYVGKVIGGVVEIDRREGGYWAPLETYLRQRRAYSGPLPKIDKSVKHVFPELQQFKRMLDDENGELILSDSEDAFLPS